MAVRAAVISGYGINCDYETMHAFELAGAKPERVHVSDLAAKRLDDYQILALPGGFSFGDDIASGKMLAQKIKAVAGAQIDKFVAEGKLVIGICNGFQAMSRYALLPELGEQKFTLTFNDSGRFEDRWVRLKPEGKCVWLEGIEELYLPVRHGEGKLVAPPAVIKDMEKRGLVALRYTSTGGKKPKYPDNPNGSTNDIAGLCDPTGRVFGLMPHPEGHLYRTNHPRWTRGEQSTLGLEVFKNAVRFAEEKL